MANKCSVNVATKTATVAESQKLVFLLGCSGDVKRAMGITAHWPEDEQKTLPILIYGLEIEADKCT